jgi:tRNA threonylcarbamoyladenosine biosynthesis protein TsaB
VALILSIETSTTNCSVSLSKKAELLVVKEDYDRKYSHSERLHTYIHDVLKHAKVSINDIDAIAISKGPGSYTGLRIGVSAAKGLCYALNKPLISIPTLESLAHQVIKNDGMIVSMLDARRLEVYSAVFDSSYEQIRETKAEILNKGSFSKYLENGKVYFIGNGVDKTKSLISDHNAVYIDDKLPSAKEMGSIAFNKFKISDFEDVAYFEPYYLKDFVALKPKS